MPRKPVGTLVRPTADWYAGQTANCGGLATSSVGSGIQLSLYNDSPAGQYLWLWWFTVGNDAEGIFRVAQLPGAQGTLIQQGEYILAGQGVAFGATYASDVPGTGTSFPTAGTRIGGMGYTDEFSSSVQYLGSLGPVSVLPPGFSFAIISEWVTSAQFASLTCWFNYSILPYIPS